MTTASDRPTDGVDVEGLDAPTTAGRAARSATTSPKRWSSTRPRKAASAFDTRPWWQPGRVELIEAGLALALAAVVGFGLTTVFDGWMALVVTVVGASGGVVAAWLVTVRRLAPVAVIGVAIGAMVLFAGPAVPETAIAGFLPGPGTPRAFVDGAVHGWRDLLTTAAPAPFTGGLGVVPYLIGFIAGFGAMLLARRTDASLLPSAPVGVAFVISIVFGDLEPRSVAVSAGGLLVIAVGWASWRANRARGQATDGIYWPRVWGSAAMLGLLVPVGLLLSSSVPFVDTTDRSVLRRHVVPPFDAAEHPSPLGALRSYRNPRSDDEADPKEKVFLTISGLPEVTEGPREGQGALIRVATMDTYDGVVWKVTGDDATGSGRFKRVGARIPYEGEGEPVAVEVTVGAYEGVWVPTIGTTERLVFTGDDSSPLTRSFRYNPQTGTAAASYRLVEGNRYRVDARLDQRPSDDVLRAASVVRGSGALSGDVASWLEKLPAAALTLMGESTDSPYEVATRIESGLQDWYYSDSPPGSTGPSNVPAGHGVARLEQFAADESRTGNAEQFAAAMAIMADQLGMESRVVFGFAPESGGTVEVTGEQATAWVEINFAGIGWVDFHPTPDTDNTPDPNPPPVETRRPEFPEFQEAAYIEPPPIVPPLAQDDEDDDCQGEGAGDEDCDEKVDVPSAGMPRPLLLAMTYLGVPGAAIAGGLGLVVAAKGLRRKRRRTRGGDVDQIHGAWAETVDQLRDLGHRPSFNQTRRELAREATEPLGWTGAVAYAAAVDRAMFSLADPDPATVESLWQRHQAERDALHASLTRLQRFRAKVSIASLRPNRDKVPGRKAPKAPPVSGRSAGAPPAAPPAEAAVGDASGEATRLRTGDAESITGARTGDAPAAQSPMAARPIADPEQTRPRRRRGRSEPDAGTDR